MENKIVIITGGFDPLHSGHISYLKAAKELGDKLIVGLNSDEWLTRKKGKPFLKWQDRFDVISNIKGVDEVLSYDDSDNSSTQAIIKVREKFPDSTIIFANGGDRTKENIPEMQLQDPNLEFVFGIGGTDKINSSSDILKEWALNRTERPWGYYDVLFNSNNIKVKILSVEPNKCLSMQKHFKRNEYWMVLEGRCLVYRGLPNDFQQVPKILSKFDELKIPVNGWHQLTNPYKKPCIIVEIQYGESCVEDDIERMQ